MSQSTDTTQVMPLAEAPQAQLDPDATQQMPLISKEEIAAHIARSNPAVPVPPPAPAFDPERNYAFHAHTVLGRILRTAGLPLPMKAEIHTFARPRINLLMLAGETAVNAYEAVFGGTRTSSEVTTSFEKQFRVDELTTVIDGIEVVVEMYTEVAAAEQTEPETGTPEAAVEPEPTHDPAPAPQPTEAPAEHPEAA